MIRIEDVWSLFEYPPEFFPKGVIAFGHVGNGDLICFDYREGKNNSDPAVVYWNHESNPKTAVSFIAKDFESFLGLLRSTEEVVNLLK